MKRLVAAAVLTTWAEFAHAHLHRPPVIESHWLALGHTIDHYHCRLDGDTTED